MYPYILSCNCIAIVVHAVILGLFIWKLIEKELLVEIFHVIPSSYNASANMSILGLQPTSASVGYFSIYIAGIVYASISIVAHIYRLYLAYAHMWSNQQGRLQCCCANYGPEEVCQMKNEARSWYFIQIVYNFTRHRWVEFGPSSTTMLLMLLVAFTRNIVLDLVSFGICNMLMIALGDLSQKMLRQYVATEQIKDRLKSIGNGKVDEHYKYELQGNVDEATSFVEYDHVSQKYMLLSKQSDTSELSSNPNLIDYQDEIVESYTYLQYMASETKANIIYVVTCSWIVGMIPWISLIVTIPSITSAPAVVFVIFAGLMVHFFMFGFLEMLHLYWVFSAKGFDVETQLLVELIYTILSVTSKSYLGIACLFLPNT